MKPITYFLSKQKDGYQLRVPQEEQYPELIIGFSSLERLAEFLPQKGYCLNLITEDEKLSKREIWSLMNYICELEE